MRNVAQRLIRWEWLILLLLIPVTLFPFAYSHLFLLLIPLFWLLRKVVAGHFVLSTPYDLSILVLLLMVGISLPLTFDAGVSGPKIAGIFLGIALLYGTVAFTRGRSRRLWAVVAFILLSGMMMAIVGLLGSEWLPPFTFLNELRGLLPFALALPGTVDGVINANELAGTLSWIVPLMFGCLLGFGRRRNSLRAPIMGPLLAAAMFTTFILVATLSRGGLMALGVGLALVALFYLSPRWRLVLAIGTVISVLVLVSYSSSQIDQSIVSDPLGFGGRLEIWSRGIQGISDFPLTGMSVNGFRRVVHALYPLYSIPSEIDLGHAHNHLLQTGLDLGIPGLISYLSLWFVSAWLLLRTRRELVLRHGTRHPYYGLVAGLSGSLLAGWFFGIFDAIALGARPTFIWWLLLGVTASVHYAVGYSGERLWRKKRRSSRATGAHQPGTPEIDSTSPDFRVGKPARTTARRPYPGPTHSTSRPPKAADP